MTAPKHTTQEYQALDAAHHIHAFLDQKALNEEGALVIAKGQPVTFLGDDLGRVEGHACGPGYKGGSVT